MADYISREALLALPTETKYDWTDCIDIEDIRNFPAADVAPVRHGRWEGYAHSRFFGYDDYGAPMYRDGTVWYCSNRECRRKTVVRERYCPSCGSKMDGGAKDEEN